MTDRTLQRAVLWGILVYALLAHALAAYIAFAPPGNSLSATFHVPDCAMRRLAGIPCPLCFGTTTFVVMWRGYWLDALKLDPFVFAVFWLSIVSIPVMAFLAFSRRQPSDWLGWISKRSWLRILAICGVAMVINWGYLIVTLRGVSPEEVLAEFPLEPVEILWVDF